jgi:hypothetical protein
VPQHIALDLGTIPPTKPLVMWRKRPFDY